MASSRSVVALSQVPGDGGLFVEGRQCHAQVFKLRAIDVHDGYPTPHAGFLICALEAIGRIAHKACTCFDAGAEQNHVTGAIRFLTEKVDCRLAYFLYRLTRTSEKDISVSLYECSPRPDLG